MRINCQNIDAFITNIRGAKLYNGKIHYDRTYVDETEFSRTVIYDLTAIIEYGQGQALVVCAILCGVDRFSEDGGRDGSDVANEAHGLIMEYCKQNNLEMLPGIIDAS